MAFSVCSSYLRWRIRIFLLLAVAFDFLWEYSWHCLFNKLNLDHGSRPIFSPPRRHFYYQYPKKKTDIKNVYLTGEEDYEFLCSVNWWLILIQVCCLCLIYGCWYGTYTVIFSNYSVKNCINAQTGATKRELTRMERRMETLGWSQLRGIFSPFTTR
jgi:hypothetical protein